jgi:hypothetical protein
MRAVATAEPWALRAAAVEARPPQQVVPWGVVALLLLLFVVVFWLRAALHVCRDLLFVVHQLIFANVSMNNVSHRFSCLLYPPH